MTTWHWVQRQGQSYLICDLLRDWSHGFFTRAFWPQPPKELTPTLSPGARAYRVKQVHGNRILSPQHLDMTSAAAQPNSEPEPHFWPEADGLLSDGNQQALWVCTADCNPVLVGDLRTGQVAAIHAGWRGTALKIVSITVEKMLALGSRHHDLVVAIGPAIAGEVYQVSTQVGLEVGQTIYDVDSLADVSDSDLMEALLAMDQPPLLPDANPERVKLDVRRVNVLQLERLGLSSAQIAVAPHCTFQESQHFFSYRRTREKKVQWSGIVSF